MQVAVRIYNKTFQMAWLNPKRNDPDGDSGPWKISRVALARSDLGYS
jgi:hypothetical protein